MNDAQLTKARAAFRRDGSVDAPLLDELAAIATALVRYEHLPPSYAPYGEWNDEAAQELLQGWLTDKLLAAGGLAALLDAAASGAAFHGLARRSLRQYVLNRRARSQAQNLYWRCAEILRDNPAFVVEQESNRPQDVVWRLGDADRAAPFSGGERDLLALAWKLGEFELIRYRAEAAKLAPLLSTEDLTRFIDGLLEVAGPMSLTTLMQALSLRFDLGEVALAPLEAGAEVADPVRALEDVELGQLALAVIAQLTHRQTLVLIDRRAEESLEAIAKRLDCSIATVANEQERIRQVIVRHSPDLESEHKLLKKIGDALYEQMENAGNGLSGTD